MVNICYFLIEGFLHTVHSYCLTVFFPQQKGNAGFPSRTLSILNRSENDSWKMGKKKKYSLVYNVQIMYNVQGLP